MNQLCHHCSAFFHYERVAIGHHDTVGALAGSAKGCALCKVIQQNWDLEALVQRFPELEGPGSDLLPLEVKAAGWSRSEATGVRWFVLEGSIHAVKRKYFSSFTITITAYVREGFSAEGSLWKGERSSLEEKCAIIKRWFEECQGNHPECVPVRDELPQRLIDVGTKERSPRLINTRDEGVSTAAYSALSHCWGDIRPLFASKNNYKQLKQTISFASIPRTFQEAILITRHLQIPYIWIDSLCILQDDPDDWKREASKMKDIYSGSTVVVSAMDGKNCSHGCFVDLNEALFDPAKAPPTQVHQFSVLPKGHAAPLMLRVYRGDVQYPPVTHILRSRGWTLQEEILANREILCEQPEIRWKCQRVKATETGHSFVVKSGGPSGPDSASTTEPHWLWCEWMSDYSSRFFTYEADRLSALVGIVQYHSERTGYRHILACWKETMITDLLWLRGREPPDPFAALPGIPSWSWLTRATNVTFDFWGGVLGDDESETDHTKIIEASTRWAGRPLLSGLLETTLILEGPIQKMRLRVDPRALEYYPPYLKVGDEEPEVSIEGGDPIPWRCAGSFDQTVRRGDEMFTCLLMRSKRFKVGDDERAESNTRETFLILVGEPGSTELVFRRAGIAMIDTKNTGFENATIERVRLV